MTTPFSQPVVPPQPNAQSFGVQELALFKTYNRESYRAAFGAEPPPYDPSRPIKSWFDSTVDTSHPENVAIYRVLGLDASNQWSMRQLVLTAQEAATVNLAGAVQYPAYKPAPTDATRGGGGINPLYMSLESDARQLMAELGGANLGDEGNSAVFPVTYPAGEPRRLWYFMYQGHPMNVGALIYNRNKNGIGSPGKWDFKTGEPVWVPDPPGPTGLDDTRPPRELPLRDLLPNERLETGPMGVHVVRTDLVAQAAADAGLFTAADRALLQAIHDMVSKLAS